MEKYIEEFDGSPWILEDIIGDGAPLVKSIFFYCDERRNPVDNSVATRADVHVYDKENNELLITAWVEIGIAKGTYNRNKEIITMLEKQAEAQSKLNSWYNLVNKK